MTRAADAAGESDFLVIGAGAAGCLLANRLSASSSVSVTLLEAGGADWNPLIRVPLMAGLLYFMPSLNWGYQTEPQDALDRRRIPWPRGRVVGGSTTINGMMYVRGHPSDYDDWSRLGLPGWSYENVLPHFRAIERNLSHGPEPDRYHGRSGEVFAARAPAKNPIYAAWLEAARQAGYSPNDDFNGVDQEGVGPFDFNIRNGRRVSAADAFLRPVRRRPNLRLVTLAPAARLLFDGARCVGAETVDGRRFLTRGEVILAAGAVNSPALLQLSGIGDAERLAALGVGPRLNLPSVGANLQDHLGVAIRLQSREAVTLHGLMRPDRALAAGVAALAFGVGPAAVCPLEVGGFLKTRGDLARPDVHVIVVPGLGVSPDRKSQNQHAFSTTAYQLRPLSRGEVCIRCPDPRQPPAIDPRYLSDPADRGCLRDSIRLLRGILAQPALDRFRGAEMLPGADVSSDAAIDQYVAATASTVFHPAGTCRMGPPGDAVVDAQLRVRGVERLRVADASIMPTIIGGNTSAPTMMIAERCAAMILAGR
jgi:choline dehydrogenase